jgi:hypothetical protein
MTKKNKFETEKLKAEVKKLRKQLSRNKKREFLYEDLEAKEAEALLKEELEERKNVSSKEKCPRCKGNVDIIDGAKIKVFICQDCDYRASVRK